MLKAFFLTVLLFVTTPLMFNPRLTAAQQMAPIVQPLITQVQTEDFQPEVTTPQESDSSEMPTQPEATDQQQATEESRSQTTSDNTQSESAGPYDMEAIKAFNRALYGS